MFLGEKKEAFNNILDKLDLALQRKTQIWLKVDTVQFKLNVMEKNAQSTRERVAEPTNRALALLDNLVTNTKSFLTRETARQRSLMNIFTRIVHKTLESNAQLSDQLSKCANETESVKISIEEDKKVVERINAEIETVQTDIEQLKATIKFILEEQEKQEKELRASSDQLLSKIMQASGVSNADEVFKCFIHHALDDKVIVNLYMHDNYLVTWYFISV